MGIVIGIDLGTTTSEIAYLKDGKPQIIVNKEGKRITPSIVGIKENGEIIVGDIAKRQLVTKPDKTVQEIKRKMGTQEKVKIGNKEFLPQEISAIILKYLKECAEEYLGEKVEEAVITVPAMFENFQRQATKDAAEIAGLKVERIINEPTSAALAYGLENMGKEERVLVYDFGGGTLDVTILEMFDGVLDVKVSRGDNKLGGKDLDERLMNYVFDECYRKYEIDLKKTPRYVQAVKDAAERAKIELSSIDSTDILIPFVQDSNGNPIDVEIKISRAKFELLIEDLIKKTSNVIDEAIHDCGIKESDIDAVLAVGGSTRVPCVKKLLKNRFGERVRLNVNPDEVVALGAAIQAGIKSGQLDSQTDIIITDVCPYSLGTDIVTEVGGRLLGGVFDRIIKRNTTIPTSGKRIYVTMLDNQKAMSINVYQGEDAFAREEMKIADFRLTDIPEAPAGEQQVEVEFSYDINGILKVGATILSTGKKDGFIINTKSMSREQIDSAISDLLGGWKKSKLAKKVENVINKAEDKLVNLDQVNRKKIEEIIRKLKEALINEDEDLVSRYDEELTDILFDMV